MTIQEFAELVEKMRVAQKLYFKTKAKEALIESKRLEKLVDTEIIRIQAAGV